MLLLVSGATATVREHQGHPHLGLLAIPAAKPSRSFYEGWTWAADNGAFTGFDEAVFTRMLDRLHGLPGCAFVACPDTVADADSTLQQFSVWAPRLRSDGWPVALVAQDGLERLRVPWDDLDAIFIGGSTDWKLGPHARHIATEATQRGKWLHVGRVNTPDRIRYCASIGANSIDGSQWSRFSRIYLPAGLASIHHLTRYPQTTIEGAAA